MKIDAVIQHIGYKIGLSNDDIKELMNWYQNPLWENLSGNEQILRNSMPQFIHDIVKEEYRRQHG